MNAIGVFLQAQVLEPIMYYKLLSRGVLFMHAGGVMNPKTKKGYLMPAHGGTGKTTFSIALLNLGYKLLGDDLLFVDANNKMVYPYARPMHIFTYNINNLKGSKIPFKYKVAIYSKNALRYILETVLKVEFLISTRIHADEVFESQPFGKACKYDKLFFLRKTGKSIDEVAIDKSNLSQKGKEIMNSADLNDSLYSMVGDKKIVKKIKQLETEVIVNLLSQFKSMVYLNTRKLDLNNLSSFEQEYLA